MTDRAPGERFVERQRVRAWNTEDGVDIMGEQRVDDGLPSRDKRHLKRILTCLSPGRACCCNPNPERDVAHSIGPVSLW